ncbi:MAG: orotate phosphoribosyltransferase [Deltaproteobacteria bacterium]|nr:orotate phosphoribosyltransferase [Deltaproteobacteria bacterium]
MTRELAYVTAMPQSKEAIANILLDIGAVVLRPDQPFTWASGIQSPIYCDNRLLISYPDLREKICDAFLETMCQHNMACDLIAGVATGAIAHAAWIADRLKKPMVYIRSEAKGHGKQNRVEGKVTKGMKAVVIEDLISTGGSSVEAVEALRQSGVTADHCIAIFQYGFPEATAKFKQINCRLETLTDFPTLLKVTKQRGTITAEQEKLLAKFIQNPRGWQTKTT